MTVTYSATKSFLLLLFKWRGSIWKALIWQYGVFLLLWYGINITYRFALTEEQQIYFEKVVRYFANGNGFIPLQFILGFYVSRVIANWWDQLQNIAWPDRFLVFVTGNMPENDPESRLIRRTFARYANLTSILVWREICLKTKKRFPTNQHLIDAGLMTAAEHDNFMAANGTYGRWFQVVSWMNQLISRCRKEGRFGETAQNRLIEELWKFRSGTGMLAMYDWINIPLVYTQVVTLATYGYFFFSLIGRQALITGRTVAKDGVDPEKDDIQMYFPLFTTLEFLFYIGWLKVGEQLRCPFGEDDDDFDMNYILDRNIHVSHMLTIALQGSGPALAPSPRWEAGEIPKLPHTLASHRVKETAPAWRLGQVHIKEKDQQLWKEGKNDSLVKRILPGREHQTHPEHKA